MIRDALAQANLILWPQLGLGIFFVFFLLMSVRTLLTARSEMEYNAQLPLSEDESLSAKD